MDDHDDALGENGEGPDGGPREAANQAGRDRRARYGGKRGQKHQPELVVGPTLPLAYLGRPVTAVCADTGEWFAVPEICAVLRLGNPTRAIEHLDDDEKGIATIQTPGGPQQVNVVSESGLYSLITRSNKPEAKAFRRWVFREVLPSIRRTGSYQMGGPQVRDDHVGPDGHQGLALNIAHPRPGSVYVVTVLNDLTARIRRGDFAALKAEAYTYDTQVMAGYLTTIAAYWHKVELFRASGLETDDGFSLGQLDQVIRDGNVVARQFLFWFLKLASDKDGELDGAQVPRGKAH